jgi:hypothetical protein
MRSMTAARRRDPPSPFVKMTMPEPLAGLNWPKERNPELFAPVVVDAQLSLQHQLRRRPRERAIAQQLRVLQRQHHPRVLRRRRVQGVRRVGREIARPGLVAAVVAMAARQVGLERLRPDEARSAQAQRREQALLGEPVERLPRHRFDRPLQEQDSFARVRVLRPRRELQRQRAAHLVVAGAPVHEAGPMRQRHARRDAPVLRLVGQVVAPEVFDQRPVEIKAAFLDELHRDQREHRLRHRAGLEDRFSRDGRAASHVADAETPCPDDIPLLHDRDRDAGHVQFAHQPWQVSIQPGDIRRERFI